MSPEWAVLLHPDRRIKWDLAGDARNWIGGLAVPTVSLVLGHPFSTFNLSILAAR